jgi:1-acyl-sn-glycerol-3-phosphate acyltransferase
MAKPGEKRYLDKRNKNLHHVYRKAGEKKEFTFQKFLVKLRGFILGTTGTRVIGLENIPQGGCIIAPSHLAYTDPFWVGLACGQLPVRFVGKSQVFRFPFLRLFLTLGGFPIKRGTNDQIAFSLALEVIENNHKLVIFPQGGIHKNINPETARWGAGYLAQKSPCPVIPARIFYNKGLGRVVVFGKTIYFENKEDPNRESNLHVAREIVANIAKLEIQDNAPAKDSA